MYSQLNHILAAEQHAQLTREAQRNRVTVELPGERRRQRLRRLGRRPAPAVQFILIRTHRA